MRKPSSLISWTHCGPDGGFSTGCESWGATNCGRGTPRREGPVLTDCGAERLATCDMLKLNSNGPAALQRAHHTQGPHIRRKYLAI